MRHLYIALAIICPELPHGSENFMVVVEGNQVSRLTLHQGGGSFQGLRE